MNNNIVNRIKIKSKIVTVSLMMQLSILFAHTEEDSGFFEHHMMNNIWLGVGVAPMYLGLLYWIVLLFIIIILVYKKL